MSKRHLNYTRRQRINRADIAISLEGAATAPSFTAVYDLSPYDLPSTADVVVEAYAEWTLMRFHFGSVSDRTEPPSTVLAEFDSTEAVRFRLKVLGTGDNQGLILAEADAIRPSDLTRREPSRSFVVVRPADLGDVAWRVAFDESQPLLMVNDRIGNWLSFLRTPIVRSLLLPEVMRQVLSKYVELGDSDDGGSAWLQHCRALTDSLHAGEPPDASDEDAADLWIDGVVRQFARRHRLWSGVTELLDGDSL